MTSGLDEESWKRSVLTVTNQCEKIVRGVAIKLFSAVIKATPVGNPSLWKSAPPKGYSGGTLRGNWQCSIGTPANGILDVKDPDGNPTVGAMMEVIDGYHLGPSLFLSNNLPYAEAIEEGHSTQRPEGMVAVNVAAFQNYLDESIRTGGE